MIYVASRASVPERSVMWREYRAAGYPIISSWIDETGEGETGSFTELWDRITNEIARCDRLVLYAETDDFPLKGALIEVGMALGMRKPVIVCLPNVTLEGPSYRPIGSWVMHGNVRRIDCVPIALEL